MQDRALVGDGHEVALVVGGALAEVLQVAGDVDRADERVRVLEVVDVLHADAGHPDHVEHDRAGVGELDTGGPRREHVARGCHQVGDDVHRLALRGAAHPVVEHRLHLRRRAPVVVDALVLLVARRDDGALLGAGGVLVVAAGVVAPLPCHLQLAGGHGLLEQARVVGGVDHLDALGAGELGVLLHELTDLGVRQPGVVQGCLEICHRATSHRATTRAVACAGARHPRARLSPRDQPSGVVLISSAPSRSAILGESSRCLRSAGDERL